MTISYRGGWPSACWMSEEGIMGGLFTVLAVIAAGAVSVYFIASPMGMQLIRKKSVSTIL